MHGHLSFLAGDLRGNMPEGSKPLGWELGMGRMIAVLVVAGILVFIVWSLSGMAKGIAAGRRARRPSGAYEFDSVYNQANRRVKGVKGPAEDRDAILGFIPTRSGVEAYLEPKTVAHPLSVVLVAGDGEWKRFELAEDSLFRKLAREEALPVFDAARVGYPQRMREYKRPRPPEEPGPQPS